MTKQQVQVYSIVTCALPPYKKHTGRNYTTFDSIGTPFKHNPLYDVVILHPGHISFTGTI